MKNSHVQTVTVGGPNGPQEPDNVTFLTCLVEG